MASYYCLSLLALLFTILCPLHLIIISAASPPPLPPTTTTAPQPPSPPSPSELQQQEEQQQLLNNIIEALIGAGDFGNWANILSAIDPSTLPFATTLFIPEDSALSHLPTTPPISFDPFIFPYHIVPQRLSFSDLIQNFTHNSRLPTLLPNKSILITNNSRSNFTLDDSPITHPDLFLTPAISAHGIGGILDYAIYGDGPDSQPPEAPTSRRRQPRRGRLPPPPAMMMGGNPILKGSDAPPCLCFNFALVFSIACTAAFVIKSDITAKV